MTLNGDLHATSSKTERNLSLWRHSVRVRLALWHTAILALLLMAFAGGAYHFLATVTERRVDRELTEAARSVILAWSIEQIEHGSTAHDAALEVLGEVHNRSLRVLMFDSSMNFVGASDSSSLTPSVGIQRLANISVSATPSRVAPPGPAAPDFRTVGEDDGWVRVGTVNAVGPAPPYTVVVARDMIADDEIKDTFLNWLFTAIPFALMLAGMGGYLLARASLSPVVAMATQAENISAGNLVERLEITNRHDELGQLAESLNGLLGRLELSFLQQQQFMADASHELRTPVSVIRGAADVALQRSDRSTLELSDTLKIVSNEGRRMTRIVDDLFLLARADSGHQPVRRTAIFLEEQLEEAASAGRALGRSHGVTVISSPLGEYPFNGDDVLISRMLLNLVDNAVKHTPAGGTITLSLDRVVNGSLASGEQLQGSWYRFSVRDSGAGVDDSIRSTLFGRFTRAPSSALRDSGSSSAGAGLGLAIAKWIAMAHDGHMVLHSSGDSGSTFHVWLPELVCILRPSEPRPPSKQWRGI